MSPNPRPQFESYPADVGAVGPGPGASSSRRPSAPRCRSQPGVAMRVARAGSGAAGDSRPRRRSRAGPAGRPAHGRSVEPVGRSRRADQPGVGPADRGRARAGDAALRRQRDRRPRQRHHRPDSRPRAVTAPPASFTFDLGSNARRRAAAGDVHVGNGKFALHLGGGGRRSGDFHTPEGDVENSQSRSGFVNVGGGVDRREGSTSAPATATTTRNTASPSSRRARSAHAASGTRSRLAPAARASTARSTRIARRSASAATSTTSSKATRSARAFKNDTDEGEVMGSHRPVGRLSGSGRRMVPESRLRRRRARKRCRRRSISGSRARSSTKR